MLYMYKKSGNSRYDLPKKSKLLGRIKHLLPTILVTLGSLLLANVAWPIIQYNFFISPNLTRTELISPIDQTKTAFFNQSSDSQTPISPQSDTIPKVAGKEPDYTNATNWFPTAEFSNQNQSKITHYTLDIPKVQIYDAVIEINGNDLSSHLIQYPGTSNPGQPGSPVIFGHSVLRQFYNPSVNNPNRYMSIFSKIMTLSDGDEIFVDYDGIRYRYAVVEKVVVNPEDIFILQQRHDRRELKLITCVPEGTYLHRGVVIAQLQNIE